MTRMFPGLKNNIFVELEIKKNCLEEEYPPIDQPGVDTYRK
jgi:hypothetical protein